MKKLARGEVSNGEEPMVGVTTVVSLVGSWEFVEGDDELLHVRLQVRLGGWSSSRLLRLFVFGHCESEDG